MPTAPTTVPCSPCRPLTAHRTGVGWPARRSPVRQRRQCSYRLDAIAARAQLRLLLSMQSGKALRAQAGTGRDDRRSSYAYGVDDFGVIDSLQVDRRDPEVGVSELALDHDRGTPSRAISTACAWRNWCGANRRRTPAVAATRRKWARAAAAAHGRPRV